MKSKKNNVTQPWTRWWWMGSAVDSINLKRNLIDLKKVGFGGVEIAPIYGVKGEEQNFIDFLSPKWLRMLDYTIFIADSLNMQVDLTLGTGWPYGGPQVTTEFAATSLKTKTYTINEGQSLAKHILLKEGEENSTEQLKYLLAYGNKGTYLNLTHLLKDNYINWKAKREDFTIYAIFIGKTGQKVKRAAPGGDGFTLDHFSKDALNTYLKPFTNALNGYEGKIRAVFNDSFEVYGSNFTPDFFDNFMKYRGYDLKMYLPLLLSKEYNEISNRVKSDYRETISDLLLFDFNRPWTTWAHDKGYKSRLQAHGSPGNLIDLYASADIPESETFGAMPYDIPGLRREKEDSRPGDADPVMIKFSSSAAHISGKPLTSSETFTWLRDHFKTAVSQCKPEVEDLFINGVNHVFLHGTTYSPQRAQWPGWKFYASVNFNSNLAPTGDHKELLSYITNCQSFLQAGRPDNDILLYWPVYDVWNSHLGASLSYPFKIHSLKEWLYDTSFYKSAKSLMESGYGLDFISDAFIKEAKFENGAIVLPGGSYKSLIIPDCQYMPLVTLEKLIALKKEGASIIFKNLPTSVPGFNDYKTQNARFSQLMEVNKALINPIEKLELNLSKANVFPEKLMNTGLKYIRRDIDGDKTYYLINHTSTEVNKFVPINGRYQEVYIIDPNTLVNGRAKIKKEKSLTWVKVQMKPGESLVLSTKKGVSNRDWEYYKVIGQPYEIFGDWNLTFLKGGPTLPQNNKISVLGSWTELSKKAESFSGSAKYEIAFDNPDLEVEHWLLNLGDVRESAKVWINDIYVGALWANPFAISVGPLKRGKNTITLEVTNLPANRIRKKELMGEEWKVFYEINMVNMNYKKFDATKWQPMPSGLLGPVTLTPIKINKTTFKH
ncbi:glycosyl hydrolase [Maribacter ulvicola]|uniref:glycosyl hydrolase n=1 Tax=Maribacter ulvicola TaxID=228959 RepID=UPI001FC9AB28|nr:glycosyl hydrolase [Maribacter ulvicola]